MAIYSKKYYKKNENGDWEFQSETYEKCFSELGRWKRSCEMEKNTGDKTYLSHSNTRGGLNKKVTQVRTYFFDGSKCVRDLITTSNKFPKSRSK